MGRVEESIEIEVPVEEVYRVWRNFENFPRFMSDIEEVHLEPSGRCHWTAVGPTGARISWETEIVEDVPNKRISWRSVGDSQLEMESWAEFHPVSPGGSALVAVTTVLRVSIEYRFRGAGEATDILPNIEVKLRDDLVKFKELMEAKAFASPQESQPQRGIRAE